MKQKRSQSSPKNVKTLKTSQQNSVCVNKDSINGINGQTIPPMNGFSGQLNGINGHHSVAIHHNQPNRQLQSRVHSKSVSNPIRSPIAVTAKPLTQTPSHSTPNRANGANNYVNTGQTPHSYPKTSQMSSLLSQQWSQSSSDPLSQSHARYAGSRFAEAPNPSLLPKPPKHWVSSDSALNTTKHEMDGHILNGIDIYSKSNDNSIAIKLMQLIDIKAVETNTMATNGHAIATSGHFGVQSYVN